MLSRVQYFSVRLVRWLVICCAGIGPLDTVISADHREAPLINLTASSADIADVYTFIGTRYDDSQAQMLNILVTMQPHSEPGSGPVYTRFDDSVRYTLHITGPTGASDLITYHFRFSDGNPTTAPGLKNPNTLLSYGVDADGALEALQGSDVSSRNFTQT